MPQRERGEVEPRGPTLGAVHQKAEVIVVDVQPHLLVQQGGGLLLGESELLGADLGYLSPCPETPQRQLWVRTAREDEVDVVGEVLYEEGYRRESIVLDYELVVIEHHYHPLRPLGQLVYEDGKRYLAEPLTRGVHAHRKTCPEVFSWRTLGRNLAQRFYNVPP